MEKLLNILKRFWPKFYNRITWTVVLAGLAIIASPLWELIVTAMISKKFDLSKYIPNEPFYGTVLVGIGLAYHLGASIVASIDTRAPNFKQQAKQEHDKLIANRFLDLASEDETIFQLDMLGSDHSCVDDRWKVISGIERFGDLSENEFLNPNIQKAFDLLHADMKELTLRIVRDFFPMHCGSRTCLYPHLNLDRGGTGSHAEIAEYNKHAQPLIKCVLSAKTNYRDFRRTLKEELAI